MATVTRPSPDSTFVYVTIGDERYRINTETGVIRDSSGVIMADATYDIRSGAFTLGDVTVDVTPKTSPVAGQTYQRNFTDTTKFSQVSYQGTTYYVNKANGNAFSPTGQYVGSYQDGEFNLFDVPDDPNAEIPPSEEQETYRRNLLQQVQGLLSQFFTPEAVDDLIQTVIKPAIQAGQTDFEVMRALRASATYKAFFPEYEARIKNGYAAWSEAQILQYRDQAKNMAKQLWGVDVKGTDLANLISNNVSLQEFEHRLLVFKQVNNMGGAVQAQLEKELGVSLTDEDLYEFFDPEINTAELDKAWENAIFKQYVNNLTGGNYEVTDEMVKNLRKIGVTANQAIQNYQKMAGALPALDRLAAIDRSVGADRDNPYDSFGTAFSAYQTLDAEAQARIGQIFARETARFDKGGGVAMQGTQAVGLLTESGRRSQRR